MAAVVAIEQYPADLPTTDDVGRLVRLIDWFGARAVAETICRLCHDGAFSVDELQRVLRRERQRARRATAARERRERHGGDEILYRGPVRVWQEFAGRVCRTVHRRAVLVSDAPADLHITGIGVACPDGFRAVEQDGEPIGFAPDGEYLPADVIPRLRSVVIPAGSRILLDTRHGASHETWACEVVRTACGNIRLHLWQSPAAMAGKAAGDLETIPVLSGGVVVDTAPSFGTRLAIPS